MLLLACTSQTAPCPLADQYWLDSSLIVSASDIGITSDQILQVLTWGFGVVLLGWMLGYALGVGVGMIKKI